jgi:ABC-type antimicrobial peptide transport system permease subunit
LTRSPIRYGNKQKILDLCLKILLEFGVTTGLRLSQSNEFVDIWLVKFIRNNWLQNFVYRITLNIWIFILFGLVALAIALLTVSYQSIRAATANPVDSLRYE